MNLLTRIKNYFLEEVEETNLGLESGRSGSQSITD